MKVLCYENYNTLKKIEDDIWKCKDIVCSWVEWTNTVKWPDFQSCYIDLCKSKQNTNSILHRWENNVEIHMESKETKNSKSNAG